MSGVKSNHAARVETVTVRDDGRASVLLVPEISCFHGIIIRMFHRDHAPPHLHAQYGEYEITVDIETLATRGVCPVHAIRRVQRWTVLHRAELLDCWRLADERAPIPRVPPLE